MQSYTKQYNSGWTHRYLFLGTNYSGPGSMKSGEQVLSVISQGKGNKRDPVEQKYELWRSAGETYTSQFRYYDPTTDLYNASVFEGSNWVSWGYNNPDPTLKTAAYNEALSRLNEMVRGGTDLSVDAFQLSQTRKMFGKTNAFLGLAKRFVRDYTYYSKSGRIPRGYRPHVFNRTRDIGSTWLEYSYGWKPLISSIYDTFQTLMHPDPLKWDRTFRARAKCFDVKKDPFGTNEGTAVTNLTVRCEIKVQLGPSQDALLGLSQYTSLNPASIAWELVPFSFIVDWFYNVGDYLRNLETALLFNRIFKTGYVTYTAENTSVITRHPRIEGNGYYILNSGPPFKNLYRFKHRTILWSYPLPKAPVFRPSLGSSRLFSAAALLSQLLRR